MKKILTFGIMLFFIGMNISSSTAGKFLFDTQPLINHSPVPKPEINIEPSYRNQNLFFLFFKLQSVITITWSGNATAEPLEPGGPPRPVELEISTIVVRGAFGAGLLALLSGFTLLNIHLQIEETSEWCIATLQNERMYAPIRDEIYKQHNILTIWVDESAPAYGLGFVKINARVDAVKSPLGLFTFITGTERTTNLNFVPSYKPLINIKFPKGNIIETPPGNVSTLPILVENHGNDRTIVKIKVTDIPVNWSVVTLAEIILDVHDEYTVPLSLKPPKNFTGIEKINLSFTPHRADDITDKGEPTFVTVYAYYFPEN